MKEMSNSTKLIHTHALNIRVSHEIVKNLKKKMQTFKNIYRTMYRSERELLQMRQRTNEKTIADKEDFVEDEDFDKRDI